jgi:hypothetical protein
LAVQTIAIERIGDIAERAIKRASKEAAASDIAIDLLNKLKPLLDQGKRFTSGRKVGTAGPIRKAIANLLAKNREIKNPELWKAIERTPPRGWTAYETPRLGKYLEGPNMKNMGYPRFCTVCGEERKEVNRKVTG